MVQNWVGSTTRQAAAPGTPFWGANYQYREFSIEENEMRFLATPLLVVLLCAGSAAQAQTRQFNPHCGLLGSFAQHREHYQHCKTTEQLRNTNVVPRQSADKCGPKVSRGISG